MTDTPFFQKFDESAPQRYAPGSWGFVTERERAAYPRLKIPELNSAFAPAWWYEGAFLTTLAASPEGVFAVPGADALAPDLEDRALPLWFKADTGPGHFKITATLAAGEKGGEALVFVSRRRLAWRGSLKPGESREIDVLSDVSPVIAAGGGDPEGEGRSRAQDITVDLTVLGAGLRAARIEPWEGPAIYIMGDSTVTDQPADYPYAPGVNYCGWGQMLPLYAGCSAVVSNHAHSGLSTETFREKGYYDVMRPLVRPGDTVLIQFGHNDQKKVHLAAKTGYTDNLIRYITELRTLGAVPVLVTSLARNTWKSESQYNDLLEAHAQAALEVGHRENVAVADLHEKMKTVILAAGLERARAWFHPGDYSHPNDFGAHLAAGFVAEELMKFALIPAFDVPDFPVRPPLTELAPPPGDLRHGNTPPTSKKPLVDYGLIPDYPWPIT